MARPRTRVDVIPPSVPDLVLPDFPTNPSQLVRAIIADVPSMVTECENQAEQMVVKDEASRACAAEVSAVIKARLDTLDAQRKEKSDPFYQVWSGINGAFKPWLDRLKSAKATVDKKAADWFLAERERQRVKEEKQREKERAAALAGKPIIPKSLPEPVAQSTRTSMGTAHMRETWAYRVIDLKKVPRKFLMVNDKLVTATIQAEAKVMPRPSDIPGLELYPVAQQITRRATR